MIKSYDSLLHLTNYKQKTIESFLNFPRTDKLDGKKLIALYNPTYSLKIPILNGCYFYTTATTLPDCMKSVPSSPTDSFTIPP